ncbi:MAG: hypothetical protein D6725_00185 [Planctomycetota bacterium]|nr:MAG: hypothetical protein D6725_00185 [Planctomycetota bacterium]
MQVTDEELLAYVNETLSEQRLVAVESAIRSSPELQRRLQMLLRSVDTGEQSVGAVWRERRLSCPSREELRLWVFGALPAEEAAYVSFHLQTVQCPYCRASAEDIRSAATDRAATERRRRRVFASSAGHLRRSGRSGSRGG